MKSWFKKGDALLIIDAQIDFFPGGALPVPYGDQILPIINKNIEEAIAKKIPIFASRDWHPINHCSFKEHGGPWPVHCIQHSPGAMIHPALKLPKDVIIIDKAIDPFIETYSAFKGRTADGQLLEQLLHEKGIRRIFINGLALDYCVCETAIEARENGFEVLLQLEGTRHIASETKLIALKRMHDAGVIIEES